MIALETDYVQLIFGGSGSVPCSLCAILLNIILPDVYKRQDKASAAAIGLFPQELLDKAKEVGNAAGNGAVSVSYTHLHAKQFLLPDCECYCNAAPIPSDRYSLILL